LRHVVNLAEELQVFQRSEVFVERNFLWNYAEQTFDFDWIFSYRCTIDQCVAGSWLKVATHHIDCRAFACSVGSQQTKDLAFPNGQGDALDRFMFAKVFYQVYYLNLCRATIGWEMDRTRGLVLTES